MSAYDPFHQQFCSLWSNPDGLCDCWGVPDRRLLLDWERAIDAWGTEDVMLKVKYGVMEPAPSAGHIVGCGLWYVEDSAFAN